MTGRGPFAVEGGRRRAALPALVLSVAVHAAVLAGARHGRGAIVATPTAAATSAAPDVWAGTSPSMGAGGDVVDVEVGAPARAAAPAEAARPAVAAAAAPPRDRAPHADGAPKRVDVGAPDRGPGAPARATPRTPAEPAARPSPRRARAPRPAAGSEGDARATPRDGAPGAGSFGAEGAASVRDLARAFTRAIPPACDADPAWKAAPLGDAGEITVDVEVDGAGHVAGFVIETASPPRHLASLARRTVALIDAGTFAIGASGGAGHQRLAIRARTSDVGAEEALAARSFGLQYAWERGRGTASFTQLGGRRVEVEVRALPR